MLSNPMLDVAIGLVFFYLLLSIIATVLQEFINSFFRLRNRNLLKAIGELIGDVGPNRKDFFQHPLIFPLFKGEVDEYTGNPKERGPAYIPSRNFAIAILDIQAKKNLPEQPQVTAKPEIKEPALVLASFFTDVAGLRARLEGFDKTASEIIDKIGSDAVKEAAYNALKEAVGELKTATDVVDTAVKELENLFDRSMDRAAGWFKVQAQSIALAISVLLAALLNADSIYIAQRLWVDEALRNQVVAAAETYYQSDQGQQQLTSLCSAEVTGQAVPVGTAETTPTAAATDQATPAGATETGATAEAAAQATPAGTEAGATELNPTQWQEVKDCTQREIKEAMDQLTAAGYPIGWEWQSQSATAQNAGPSAASQTEGQSAASQAEDDWQLSIGPLRGQPDQTWPGAILGILLTGLAVSLGSSFWFDLLGKFMNVRMTGKREDTVTPPPERPSGGEASRTDSRYPS